MRNFLLAFFFLFAGLVCANLSSTFPTRIS